MSEKVFKLIRISKISYGAFGNLLDGNKPFAVTLEYTHTTKEGEITKIPAGIFKCLSTMYWKGRHPTFEVIVEGHSRILFHKGNVEGDTEGCILVAERFSDFKQVPGIAMSEEGFDEFMRRAHGLKSFLLEVYDPPAPHPHTDDTQALVL